MKYILLFIALMLCFISPLQAGTFLDLEPGVSTKEDVINKLGMPIREGIKNEQYDFDGEIHDLERVIIYFYKDSQIIRRMDLYPNAVYHKINFTEWFAVEEPFKRGRDGESKLFEYYLPQGISLHYSGENNMAPIEFFSHFDPVLFEDHSMLPEERPYFGVRLATHRSEGYRVLSVDTGGPADLGGMQKGDTIVEVGERTFYETGLDPMSFMDVLYFLPIGEPISFVVYRDVKKDNAIRREQFKLSLILTPMTAANVDMIIRESLNLYARGRMHLSRNDVYGAMDIFKNALWINPYEAAFYTGLGEAYVRIGLKDFAMDEFQKAVKMRPQPVAYYLIAMLHIDKGEYDEGVDALRKSIALNPKDTEAWYQLGLVYFELARFEMSLEMFERVFALNADSPRATYYTAVCYDKLHENEKALLFYEQYLATKHRNRDMYVSAEERVAALRGESAIAIGKEDEPKSLFDSLRRKKKDK